MTRGDDNIDYIEREIRKTWNQNPFHPRRQHTTSNKTTKRLKKLPVFVTDRPFDIKGKKKHIPRKSSMHHITSTKAPRKVRQRALSTFKRYPTLVKKIETQKPSVVVFTSAPKRKITKTRRGDLVREGYGRTDVAKNIKTGKPSSVIVVRTPDYPYAKTPKTKWTTDDTEQTGKTLFHELYHDKQFRKYRRIGLKSKDINWKEHERKAEEHAKKSVKD